MAVYVPVKLIAVAPATAVSTLYTVPAAVKVLLKAIELTNTTASTAAVTVILAGQTFLGNVAVPANTTLSIPLSYVLVAADTITAVQGTASAIILHINGLTY